MEQVRALQKVIDQRDVVGVAAAMCQSAALMSSAEHSSLFLVDKQVGLCAPWLSAPSLYGHGADSRGN